MANVLIEQTTMENIADAIRAKNGSSDTYKPAQMPTAIENLPSGATLQSKSVSYTPTESAQSATVTADSGYDGLSSVGVSVGAISSTYVGTGITRRSSSDLTASGATVTAPSGYYSSSASKAVSSGSATSPASISGTGASVSTGTNTITLSKTISVTPTVSAGYVSSGTAGNSSVSLTASVTTKSAQTYTPTTSTQTIAANQYLTGAQTINPIPSEYIIPSGSISITSNGTVDVTNYASADVSVSGGGSSMNVQIAAGVNRIASSSYTAVSGQQLTVAVTGTYDVYWVGYRSSTSGTSGSQLYIGSTAYGSANTTFSNNGQSVHLSNVSLTKNQVVSVRARARSSSYYMYVGNLTIIQSS